MADVAHLDGSWSFRRIDGELPGEALAVVRDPDGWSALVPATTHAADRFAVTVTRFSPTIECSGYIGWLGSAIKRQLGSGIFVICGDDPHRGGIFDYLGYPLEVAESVRALLDELRVPAEADPFALDFQVFEVVETSPASAISGDTYFEFRERDGLVEASYAGGEIARGFLVARRHGDRLAGGYTQLDVGGDVRTGVSDMRIERTAAGRLQLTESYKWSDGSTGRNVLSSVERRHGS